ncbi:MAG: copper chaperone PCu(A)C [Sphingomonadaceae bacterium]
MKKTLFVSLALGIASLALSACGDTTSQDATAEAPDGVPGLAVTDARMILAPVAGNPAAVYFDLTYSGDKNIALRAADVAGAKSAPMHDYAEWDGKMQMMDMLPVVLKNGDTLSFAPGGKHIMAMDVSPDLKPGDTTEVTLTFAGGDKFSFPAEIRAAGDER